MGKARKNSNFSICLDILVFDSIWRRMVQTDYYATLLFFTFRVGTDYNFSPPTPICREKKPKTTPHNFSKNNLTFFPKKPQQIVHFISLSIKLLYLPPA